MNRLQGIIATNIIQYLLTRKFFAPLVGLFLVFVTWGSAQFGVDMTENAQLVVTTFILAMTSLVVHGDIRYDFLIEQQQAITAELNMMPASETLVIEPDTEKNAAA